MSAADRVFLFAIVAGAILGYLVARFYAHRRQKLFWVTLGLLLLVLSTNICVQLTQAFAQPASEKRFVRSPDGYVCELTIEGNLGKSVCRLPRAEYANYYITYIEFNPGTNRVFIDTYRPTQYDDIMMVRRENMTIDEFEVRYGP